MALQQRERGLVDRPHVHVERRRLVRAIEAGQGGVRPHQRVPADPAVTVDRRRAPAQFAPNPAQRSILRHLGPVALTQRIVLQPTGDETKVPRGKRRLWFAPDQAFGDGSHATTRLAARATERLCRELSPARVLDVGTGNGVLALVAAISCRGRVLGLDVAPAALGAARRNATKNRLSDRCKFSRRPLAQVRGRFDLVLANIEAWVLLELAADLARVTAPAGHLVLSGLLCERGDELLARLQAEGLSEVGRDEEDGWLGLVLRPSARA